MYLIMRLCTAKEKKAIFHSWEQVSKIIPPSPMRDGHQGGTIRYTSAIIEYEDGSVESVAPNEIMFNDTKKIIDKLDHGMVKWEAKQQRRQNDE